MFKKLTDDVYFGDCQSPFEFREAKCIINVAHRLKPPYFEQLGTLPHTTLYVRHALKDRDNVTMPYLLTLKEIVECARAMGKLPILTHCRMGGHRGPTAALAAAFFLSNKPLSCLHSELLELVPGLKRGRNYYQSMLSRLEWLSQ